MRIKWLMLITFLTFFMFHRVALSDGFGDWIVSGDSIYRTAFTAASNSTLGNGHLVYTCVKNEAGCKYTLSISESCLEGEEITIQISTDTLQYETISTCTYIYSRGGDIASLKFNSLGPIGESLSTSSELRIKSLGRLVVIDYKASLVGASQGIFYVNGLYAE